MSLIKKFSISIFTLLFMSSVNVSAYVFDVWELEGSNPQEVAAATEKFKAKAMAGGAKYLDIRSSVKIRGDRSQDSSFVIGYYENMQSMLETNALVQQNPDWLTSTFGEYDWLVTTSSTFGNNDDFSGEIAAGNATAYTLAEVTDGFNYLVNFPKLVQKMQEMGAPATLNRASCAICGSETQPATAAMWMSAANASDLGKAMDIFASNEMQRWLYANMAPFIEVTDQGIHVVTSN